MIEARLQHQSDNLSDDGDGQENGPVFEVLSDLGIFIFIFVFVFCDEIAA